MNTAFADHLANDRNGYVEFDVHLNGRKLSHLNLGDALQKATAT